MEIVIWFGLWGCVGYCAATARGWNAIIGFIAGAVLGPLALLLFAVDGVASRPSKQLMIKKCGACAEMVHPDAKVCRYCGAKFDW
jgi:hypothetical protein